MKSKGSSTTQTQQVSQNTSVTVQNVIEDRGLEPLEKVKLLSDVLTSIDQSDAIKRQSGPPVVVTQTSTLDLLRDPNFIIIASSMLAGLVILAKRVK